MHHLTASLLALAALTPSTLADFRIYIGSSNSVSEGGSTTTTDMYILAGEPSCDDVTNYHSPIVQDRENDASSGGWACDGCDTNPVADWIVDRFEFYNGEDAIGSATDSPFPVLSEATGSTTLYGSGNGQYNLVDEGNNQLGTCDRPAEPDTAFCSQFIAAQDLTHAFTCYTSLSPNERTKTG